MNRHFFHILEDGTFKSPIIIQAAHVSGRFALIDNERTNRKRTSVFYDAFHDFAHYIYIGGVGICDDAHKRLFNQIICHIFIIMTGMTGYCGPQFVVWPSFQSSVNRGVDLETKRVFPPSSWVKFITIVFIVVGPFYGSSHQRKINRMQNSSKSAIWLDLLQGRYK